MLFYLLIGMYYFDYSTKKKCRQSKVTSILSLEACKQSMDAAEEIQAP